ncbi:hypothetical protein AGR1C_pAt40391 [Agrobacterium fabacearum TT111]|nr:hypothetical protein AGR1C_pAt40391 [Agrobacterium fabacearum TT111]
MRITKRGGLSRDDDVAGKGDFDSASAGGTMNRDRDDEV